MGNTTNRNGTNSDLLAGAEMMIEDLDDRGTDRGFGGYVGANRHVPPYGHFHVETLPPAHASSYGDEPGRNPNYGSKGQDGAPVSGHVAKAALVKGLG